MLPVICDYQYISADVILIDGKVPLNEVEINRGLK